VGKRKCAEEAMQKILAGGISKEINELQWHYLSLLYKTTPRKKCYNDVSC